MFSIFDPTPCFRYVILKTHLEQPAAHGVRVPLTQGKIRTERVHSIVFLQYFRGAETYTTLRWGYSVVRSLDQPSRPPVVALTPPRWNSELSPTSSSKLPDPLRFNLFQSAKKWLNSLTAPNIFNIYLPNIRLIPFGFCCWLMLNCGEAAPSLTSLAPFSVSAAK